MKKLKISILLFVFILLAVVYWQYPRLNIISGYAVKNMSSNVFVANRTPEEVNGIDNNVPNIKLAETVVDSKTKMATSTVFGVMERKAFYREGQGSVLIDDNFDTTQKFLIPKRTRVSDTIPFPYGNGASKDSLFANINYEKLRKATEHAFEEDRTTFSKNTRSLLVLYKGNIITERYAEGFDKNTRLLGWSMAKSILATAFGVLEKEQNFDIHKPVIDVHAIEEWKQDKRSKITTHHLLKMISGLDWEENYTKISDVTKMLFLERDMTKSQAIKKASYAPGENFIYSSGTTNLLSGILRSQFETHQEYLDFLYTHFLDKIGMNSMIMETDMEGNYVGSSYAWATTRDWAKFGLLYLNKGNWNGDQIFNESWADYTATPTKASDNEYGTQFWTNTESFMPNAPKDMYYADGYHGQRVFIIPSLELVVVRTGLTQFNRTDAYDLMDELLKEIIECIE